MNVFADLHAHTTNSDGAMELEEVPDVANDAGVSVVAITDHDSIHPGMDEMVVEIDGVTLLRSIELRVETPHQFNRRVDLLGYGVTRTDALEDEIERLQTDRATRSQRIIENVEDALGITLDIEGEEGMGRPHIARATASHPDVELDYGGVFEEVIGNNCPAYVSREVTSFAEGVDLLSDACEVVGLAHPFRYSAPEKALELTEELDAVEGPYPYSHDVDYSLVDDVAEKNDLLVLGGTDAHEHTLGTKGLTETEFGDVRDNLGL